MKKSMHKNLSIIVPVYNEINAIDNCIKSLIEIKAQNLDYEIQILIVDDGSSDGTAEHLKSIYVDKENITVIFHQENCGYGAAIKSGIEEAVHEYIAITDADDTYPNRRLIEFLDITLENNLDMLVGSRVGKNVHIPVLRRFPKMVLNLLASYLTERNIPDLNSGLRVIKKNVIENFLYILPDGFSLTSTITLATLTNGYKVHYEKIDYMPREGKSKIKPIADTLNFLTLIVRTVLLFRPLKIFIPLFLLLFIPGIALFIFRVISGGGFAISSMILLLASIQVLAIGMLADLVDRKISSK